MALTTAAQQIICEGGSQAGQNLPDPYWELLEGYRSLLINQALAIVGNVEDAEDVVQETFREAFTHQDKLQDARSLSAWLRSINRANALNRRTDGQRRAANLKRKNQEQPERALTTGGYGLVEAREAVARTIEQLPERQREAIVLRYWEKCSYDEIAVRLQIPAGTARRIVWEAAEDLHAKLNRYWTAKTT